jgi:hypothetical protein
MPRGNPSGGDTPGKNERWHLVLDGKLNGSDLILVQA